MKRAVVIRLGAYGDVIQVSPIFRILKEQGYHVTFYCKPQGKNLVQYDPHIDKFRFHDESVQLNNLTDYLREKIYPEYDRVADLSGVVEKGLLALEGTPEFNWSHKLRNDRFNKNYSDAYMEKAALSERGLNPELYFSQLEISMAKKFMAKYRNKFVIMWSLSGSSYHKTYPYAEYVGKALYKHPDIEILTVGDTLCEMLEWHNSRTHNYSGKWSFRKTMTLTKFVNLVIGTETGVLNAASAFDTPKIVLLSHSSGENLTKHWKNVTNMWADVPCYPCHCLNHTMRGCDKEMAINSPVCMSRIHAKDVYAVIMKNYRDWKENQWQPSAGATNRTMKKMADCLTAP